MKYCDDCKQQPAQVTVTIVHKGHAVERAVCPACTPKYTPGLQGWPGPPALPVLAPWLGTPAHPAVPGPNSLIHPPSSGVPLSGVLHAEAMACGICRYSVKQLQQTGRLGCPHCYESFAPHIQLLLRRTQGGALHHGGKKPARQAGRAALERQIATLRSRLEEAVKAERYEEAVVLRDQIRALTQAAAEVLAQRQEELR